MNMNHHSVLVDVGYLQIQALMKPEATGIDGSQVGIIMEGFNTPQDLVNFVFTEHGRESMFALGFEDIEDMPVVFKDIGVEETDAAIVPPGRDAWCLDPTRQHFCGVGNSLEALPRRWPLVSFGRTH